MLIYWTLLLAGTCLSVTASRSGFNLAPIAVHYDAHVEMREKIIAHTAGVKEDGETKIPITEKDMPPAQFATGGLYPHESTTRERKPLDGIWNFRLSPRDNPDQGFDESWFASPLSTTGDVIAMAVPSSYNDITQDKTIRDHVGWAW